MSVKNGAIVACCWCGEGVYKSLSRLKRKAFCSIDCKSKYASKYASGENHSCWKLGEHINNYGYRIVHCKPEHRTIVENIIGRKLKKDEIVHHINGNKTDNRNTNFLLCSRSYHADLHKTMASRYQQEHFI